MIPNICVKCIQHTLEVNTDSETKCMPACVAYRDESWHYDRMNDDCPLMKYLYNKTLNNIFTFISNDVEMAMNKGLEEESKCRKKK